MCNVPEGTVTAEAAGSSPSRKSLTINSCFVVYYRPIFLISFLQEVFLRSVILFQSDFCFIRKYLRFRLRSFEFRRCGRSIKRIVALSRSALVRHVQVTPQEVHHPRHHENGQRLAGNVAQSETWVPGPTSTITALIGI